jgi:hypothetical protein
MSELNPSYLELEVINIRTKKTINFKINTSNVTMPHKLTFNILPKKYQVEFTKIPIAGDPSYGGMNYYAAKELKIPFEHGPEVVVIAMQTTGDPAKREEKILCTIAHEILEAELMSTGLPYHIAHMYAMQYEKGIHNSSSFHKNLL